LEPLPDEDPGRDPGLELPPDPFPDWHAFTVWDDFPAADTGDPRWSEPLGIPSLEDCLL
jgi:hypothetical protein